MPPPKVPPLHSGGSRGVRYATVPDTPDTTMLVSLFKNQLKKFLTDKQTLGDDINWIEHNYYPF